MKDQGFLERTLLYFWVVLTATVVLEGCSHFNRKSIRNLDSEIKNLHGRISLEVRKELQKGIRASNDRINEAGVDLNMLGTRASRMKDQMDTLKKKFDDLAMRIKKHSERAVPGPLLSMENDLSTLEKDLNQLKEDH